MSVEEMQVIFEGGFQLIVWVYMLGLVIGTVLDIIRMGMDK